MKIISFEVLNFTINNVNTTRIYGLGNDNNMYFWDWDEHVWSIVNREK